MGNRARFPKKNVGAPGDPILGVKNDPFCYCSSLSPRILLKISQKIALLKTFRTMQVTPTSKMSLTLKSGHIPLMTSYMVNPLGSKKSKKNFLLFFYELKHSDSKNAIKNVCPENFHCEVTLVQDLEFFWVQNYEMSYEVIDF